MTSLTSLLLTVLVAFTLTVRAQWGGSFGNDGANPVPGGSAAFGSGGPNPATSGPGSFGQQGAAGGGTSGNRRQGPGGPTITDQFDPFPKDSGDKEFDDQWVPTGRPGFDPPPSVKKMLEQNAMSRKGPSDHARTQGRDGFSHSKGQEAQADDEQYEDVEDPIPKEAPGRKGQGKAMDKCLRQVAHFCSLRVMQENFAAFNDCVYEMRYRLRADCQPWAEGHGFCARDMVTHCPKMTPADTTECLHKKKFSLSKDCVDSNFYASMEEGFKDFRKGMKEGMKGKPQGPGKYSGPQTTEEEDGDLMPNIMKDNPLADEEDVEVIPSAASRTAGRPRHSDRHEEL